MPYTNLEPTTCGELFPEEFKTNRRHRRRKIEGEKTIIQTELGFDHPGELQLFGGTDDEQRDPHPISHQLVD